MIRHGFVLSQPISGCVQEHSLLGHVPSLGFQLPLPPVEPFFQPVSVLREHLRNFRQGKADVLQGGDPAHGRPLVRPVVPVIGPGVRFGGLEQPNFIVMAKHPNAYTGQLREFSNFHQHGGTSCCCFFLSSRLS